ncbi:MAG: HAMP domain-containing histidine kinase [Actinobacteria bacterium]|nr:HAMP domain-containing histidine kinase [Actinomycetota bacterium]MBW3649501.1 HAMP domain-containing histidine kinase [Actinomycetota bacterium]
MTASRKGVVERWMSRVVLARPPGAATRAAIVVVSTAAVFGIGVVDYVSGQKLSLAIFYLLPVMVVATLVGSTAAYLLAIGSAVVWVAAEALLQHQPGVAASAANGAVRAATLSVVVVLLGALRHSVTDAEASSQSAKAFLSTAAHQLRTPVTGLVVTAEAVVAEPDPARRARLADTLAVSTARVSRLLGLLLQVARLDQGGGLQLRPTRLDEIVEREVELVALHHPAVAFRLDHQHLPLVPLDGHSLAEAVANLLDNAGRHARSVVDVVVCSESGRLLLTVVDDGAGVPFGAEEVIFDRFVSLDGRGGSGLGLAIARAAVEAHGGSLVYRAGGFQLQIPVPVSGRRSERPAEPDRGAAGDGLPAVTAERCR